MLLETIPADIPIEFLFDSSARRLEVEIDAFRPHIVIVSGHGHYDELRGEHYLALRDDGHIRTARDRSAVCFLRLRTPRALDMRKRATRRAGHRRRHGAPGRCHRFLVPRHDHNGNTEHRVLAPRSSSGAKPSMRQWQQYAPLTATTSMPSSTPSISIGVAHGHCTSATSLRDSPVRQQPGAPAWSSPLAC